MKKKIYINGALVLILSIIFYSCLPDRLPSEPTPIDRPQFMSFDAIGGNGVNIPLNAAITMRFNESMDLSTFPDNFKVESSEGSIEGNFTYGKSDTIVIFTPRTDYNPAEYYTATLHGGVMDKYGNSMISPTKPDDPQSTWFFTSGKYSDGGFPYIFVRDKVNKKIIYRAGNLNEYKDSLSLPGTEDYENEPMAVDPIMDYLYVVDLTATNGYVTIINPTSLSVINRVQVGFGPTDICFSDDKAFTANNFDKSFSIITLNTQALDQTVKFSDGFAPQNVVYSKSANKIFFSSLTAPSLEVVNANNYQDNHQLTNVAGKKLSDIIVTQDGSKIFMMESKSSKILVLNAASEQVIDTLDFGYNYNVDAVMGTKAIFVAYYSGTGGEHNGGLLKIDANTNGLLAHLEWTYQVDKMKLTAADELLYCVTPTDSTIQIVSADQLNKISEIKVKGSLNYLAITKNNY